MKKMIANLPFTSYLLVARFKFKNVYNEKSEKIATGYPYKLSFYLLFYYVTISSIFPFLEITFSQGSFTCTYIYIGVWKVPYKN